MFSIMALKIGSESDKISRKNCLGQRLASFSLEILSPSSPILGQNWKHDLFRWCFKLKFPQFSQFFQTLLKFPLKFFMSSHLGWQDGTINVTLVVCCLSLVVVYRCLPLLVVCLLSLFVNWFFFFHCLYFVVFSLLFVVICFKKPCSYRRCLLENRDGSYFILWIIGGFFSLE